MCHFQRGGGCRIKLSEPLLKYRCVASMALCCVQQYNSLTGFGHATLICCSEQSVCLQPYVYGRVTMLLGQH